MFPMPLMDFTLMGHAPARSQVPLPTWLDVATRQFVREQLTLEEFESAVDWLYETGRADRPAPPPHPVHGYRYGIQLP